MASDFKITLIPLPELDPVEKRLISKGVNLCEFNEVLEAARKQGVELVKGRVVTAAELSDYFEKSGRGQLESVVHEAHFNLRHHGNIVESSCSIPGSHSKKIGPSL